jgi:hypothetical protein
VRRTIAVGLPGRWARAVACAALCAGSAAHAQWPEGYSLLGFKMVHTPTEPFEYYVYGGPNWPTNLLPGQAQLAVERTYDRWQEVACAYPAFTSLGLSTNNLQIPNARGDPYDVFNVTVIWVSNPADPFYNSVLGGGVATAVALPVSYAGQLYQCDIVFNAVDFTWSIDTPTQSGAADLETVLVHEVGHCLGLGHSSGTQDVMFPSPLIGSQLRALSQRDVQALCALYPLSGAVGSPCQSTPECGDAGLHCVAEPRPDGGTAPAICSTGCELPLTQCPQPFVCKESNLIAPWPGACLPANGEYVTQVGKPCGRNADCGSALGQCIPSSNRPSGFPAWQNGYCTQSCDATDLPCPAESSCILAGSQPVCLKVCRLGAGDCRPGYSCAPSSDGQAVCVPSCHNDAECGGAEYTCRTCDGICLPIQNPTGRIGDNCTHDGQCGTGQQCLRFWEEATQGICAQACASACTACPAGSRCHPLLYGDLYCLRDCVDGTCAIGQQCGYLLTGRACIPPCSEDAECPVGTVCRQGACVNPLGDGGTCALCPGPAPVEPDAGGGDAGAGGGGGGGLVCGCSSGGSGLLLALLGAAWLARSRRRRAPLRR